MEHKLSSELHYVYLNLFISTGVLSPKMNPTRIIDKCRKPDERGITQTNVMQVSVFLTMTVDPNLIYKIFIAFKHIFITLLILLSGVVAHILDLKNLYQ